jgi:hypothetical protein
VRSPEKRVGVRYRAPIVRNSRLAPQACSPLIGRSLFGFARPAPLPLPRGATVPSNSATLFCSLRNSLSMAWRWPPSRLTSGTFFQRHRRRSCLTFHRRRPPQSWRCPSQCPRRRCCRYSSCHPPRQKHCAHHPLGGQLQSRLVRASAFTVTFQPHVPGRQKLLLVNAALQRSAQKTLPAANAPIETRAVAVRAPAIRSQWRRVTHHSLTNRAPSKRFH